MWSLLKAIPGFVGAVAQLLGIAWQVFRLLREWYDREQRKAVAKEIKEAIREARETRDNSRLNDVFNPLSNPYLAKKLVKDEATYPHVDPVDCARRGCGVCREKNSSL